MSLRFSANLSMLYPEHAFLDRFAAAAKDGFTGVEYVGPYDYPKHQIAQLLRDFSLRQVLFNMPAGDWAAGERGLAAVPGREHEFRGSVDLAIEYAVALECPQVHCMAGIMPVGADLAQCEAVLVRNLAYAAPLFAEQGVRLLVEPINPVDMPGYVLTGIEQGERILHAVGSDNLFLQFDFYHRAMQGGELIDSFARLQERVAHVQVADVPGRREPGTGTVDYPAVFSMLERLDYDGWVGAEYRPAAGTSDGLGWMRDL
ncbi:2-oxo-tetronate isomerase [Devosia sp.]|uniref:2-oxo-tetronate isomerase n=1 Tax=Devosia sp. TaxID=1871048 RepID=UPI003262E962